MKIKTNKNLMDRNKLIPTLLKGEYWVFNTVKTLLLVAEPIVMSETIKKLITIPIFISSPK